jgi:hypothetical protein
MKHPAAETIVWKNLGNMLTKKQRLSTYKELILLFPDTSSSDPSSSISVAKGIV